MNKKAGSRDPLEARARRWKSSKSKRHGSSQSMFKFIKHILNQPL